MAVPAIVHGTSVDASVNRLDLGGGVFIAHDDSSQTDRRTRPTDGMMWVQEAASCLDSTALMNKSVDRRLIDTGCGCDLISKSQVASARRWIRQAAKSRTFQTANGVTTADRVARVTIDEFGEEVFPYVLDSTPTVLSVGYRCMHLVYSFV